jgi:hypothetical protein
MIEYGIAHFDLKCSLQYLSLVSKAVDGEVLFTERRNIVPVTEI